MYEKAITISGLLTRGLRDKEQKFRTLDAKHQRTFSTSVSRNPLVALPMITGHAAENFYTDSKANTYMEDPLESSSDRRVFNEDGTMRYADNFLMGESIRDIKRKLKSAKESGMIITASSRQNFLQNTGERYGRGESEERGFYSTHTYTVIGIEEKNGIDYVRLRNPWGEGAVEEIRNPLTGIVSFRKSENRFGTFVIDIKSFVTYFATITTTRI
jgi:hypothetical protein